jgi:molybdopterin converting factor small subunit
VRVEVRLFATLALFLPGTSRDGAAILDVPADSTVRDVIERLGIPLELERVTLVNDHTAAPDRTLQAGDVLTLFPPLVGGCS